MANLRAWINEGAGRWTVIVICLLLVVAGIFAAVKFGPWSGNRRADVIRGRGIEVMYVCQNPDCGKRGKTRVAFDEKFPIECPHCRKRQTVPGVVCVRCKNIIPLQKGSVRVCPICGRTSDYRPPPAGGGRPR